MFRPASTSDLDLLLSARAKDPVGIIDAERYRHELELHQYRPEWSWLHEINGRLVARALWWGQPHSDYPVSLDCLWVDPSISDPGIIAGRLVEGRVAQLLEQLLDHGAHPDDLRRRVDRLVVGRRVEF